MRLLKAPMLISIIAIVFLTSLTVAKVPPLIVELKLEKNYVSIHEYVPYNVTVYVQPPYVYFGWLNYTLVCVNEKVPYTKLTAFGDIHVVGTKGKAIGWVRFDVPGPWTCIAYVYEGLTQYPPPENSARSLPVKIMVVKISLPNIHFRKVYLKFEKNVAYVNETVRFQLYVELEEKVSLTGAYDVVCYGKKPENGAYTIGLLKVIKGSAIVTGTIRFSAPDIYDCVAKVRLANKTAMSNWVRLTVIVKSRSTITSHKMHKQLYKRHNLKKSALTINDIAIPIIVFAIILCVVIITIKMRKRNKPVLTHVKK